MNNKVRRQSKTDMNKNFAFLAIGLLAFFSSCQKQQTEAERKIEVERQVQQRLDAEHQAEQQQQLAQRQADLDAREKTLATKENAAANTPQPETSVVRGERDLSQTSPTASYSTFYNRLEPLGVWRETSTYGYVWQPREAEQSRGWRPYTNGRWVYTDAGWTWISEEPFGWATYHYGRWARLRNVGWVWVPGDEWAPAWVSWRKGNDYVGWAPLPPEAHFDRGTGIQNWADSYYDIGPEQYCFVPTREFGGQRTERALVPAERNVSIVNQTTNVTNITYNNATVVNGGPSYDELRTRTQQPIERLRLERRVTVNVETENPRSVVRGEVVEMPAPVIARAQLAERPRSVKETVTQTVVDHGWEAIGDRQAADKARAKMKAESTPPPNAPSKTFVKPAGTAAQIGGISPARSTSPPGSTSVATSPVTAPSSSPPAQPKQTAPAKFTQTPRPTVAITPAATPFRREQPKLSPKPIASVYTTPPATPGPTVRETATATAPSLSASASVSPAVPGSTSVPPAFGHSAEGRQQRKTEKQLRKHEEQTEGVKQQSPPASAASVSPSATTAPSASPLSPSDARKSKKEERQTRKEEKRNRKGGAERTPDENKTSPSPSPAD